MYTTGNNETDWWCSWPLWLLVWKNKSERSCFHFAISCFPPFIFSFMHLFISFLLSSLLPFHPLPLSPCLLSLRLFLYLFYSFVSFMLCFSVKLLSQLWILPSQLPLSKCVYIVSPVNTQSIKQTKAANAHTFFNSSSHHLLRHQLSLLFFFVNHFRSQHTYPPSNSEQQLPNEAPPQWRVRYNYVMSHVWKRHEKKRNLLHNRHGSSTATKSKSCL